MKNLLLTACAVTLLYVSDVNAQQGGYPAGFVPPPSRDFPQGKVPRGNRLPFRDHTGRVYTVPGPASPFRANYSSPFAGRPTLPAEIMNSLPLNENGVRVDPTVRPIDGVVYYEDGGFFDPESFTYDEERGIWVNGRDITPYGGYYPTLNPDDGYHYQPSDYTVRQNPKLYEAQGSVYQYPEPVERPRERPIYQGGPQQVPAGPAPKAAPTATRQGYTFQNGKLVPAGN